MKKLFLLRIFSSCLVVILIGCLCFISGCKQGESLAVAEVIPSDSLLQEFSQSPPMIRDILLQKLEEADKKGNNVLLAATFDDREARLRGINAIPLNLEEKMEVKLNDRGISGDEKASDGVFSIALKASDDELVALFNNNNKILERQKNVITSFVGRVATVRQVRQFNMDSLKIARKIPFEVLILSSVTAATLPDIRNKSLMITDVSVVEDLGKTYDPCRSPNKGNADGAWSFKTLMANMAGTLTAEQFIIDWVDNFLFGQHSLSSTDGTTDRLRSKERLIKAWMRNSGVTVPIVAGVPVGWQSTALKAEEFPVRLLAIVNRLDLRGNPGYGKFTNAGEGRFVFSFVDPLAGCSNGGNGPGTMTFILEYGIPIKGCQALIDYGKEWWDLQTEAFGPDFNTKLEAITDVFTSKDANPSRPNGSALNHLRTNDFLRSAVNISTDPWDIRDFEIDESTSKLKIIHPNREPMESSNGFGTVAVNSAKLSAIVDFANSLPFTLANPNPSYTIPDDVKGMHGPMRVFPGVRYHWKGDATNIIDPFKRREFSFNTCSGCHKGETNTDFTHIRPRAVSNAAQLSGFMTGLGADDNPDTDTDPMGKFWVDDPGPPPPPPSVSQPQRGFNEAHFRAKSLEDLVFNSSCTRKPLFPNTLVAIERILRFRPLNMEH